MSHFFQKKIDKYFFQVYSAISKDKGVFEWKHSETLFCFSILIKSYLFDKGKGVLNVKNIEGAFPVI